MVDKRTWFIMGYFFAFFSIYLMSFMYVVFMNFIDRRITEENTYLYTANATTGLSSTASWLPTIGIIVAIGIILSTLLSAFSFTQGSNA